MKILLIMLAAVWGLGLLYGLFRPPPAGFSLSGPLRPARRLEFLCDLSYSRDGLRCHEQRILPAMLTEIGRAERFIIVDMFLFNRFGAPAGRQPAQPSPVEQLAGALVAARQARPQLPVLFITDQINTGYGSYAEPHLERLAAAGIEVVATDLTRLPDPNPLYSGLWRPLLQWLRPGDGRRGRLLNPLAAGAPPLQLASWLRLLNFKANHRKLLITEQAAVVSSGNIHDASGRHSNIAFLVSGRIIADLAAAELAVARFSGHDMVLPAPVAGAAEPDGAAAEPPQVRLLNEGAIEKRLLAALRAAGAGDTIWLAQFYLTRRPLLAALVAAAGRGAEVRLILDPSRDAFGYDKRGIPNRQAAARLAAAGGRLTIRWYDTRGEQFHVKLALVEYDDRVVIIGGSANLTRRSLAGYNLETCLEIRAGRQAAVAIAVGRFFARLWENRQGHYTLDYRAFADRSPVKSAWAAWQEFSGMGTF